MDVSERGLSPTVREGSSAAPKTGALLTVGLVPRFVIFPTIVLVLLTATVTLAQTKRVVSCKIPFVPIN